MTNVQNFLFQKLPKFNVLVKAYWRDGKTAVPAYAGPLTSDVVILGQRYLQIFLLPFFSNTLLSDSNFVLKQD